MRHLASSNISSLDQGILKAIYQKRWKVEGYDESLQAKRGGYLHAALECVYARQPLPGESVRLCTLGSLTGTRILSRRSVCGSTLSKPAPSLIPFREEKPRVWLLLRMARPSSSGK